MSDANISPQMVAVDDLYAALGLVTGEAVHEVTHTLLFLRQLVSSSQAGAGPTHEVMAFAGQEIARLERLLGNLRLFKPPVPKHEAIQLLDVVQRILTELRSPPHAADHHSEVDVSSSLTVLTDSQFLTRALSNLLEHARGAAGPGGAYGIRSATAQPEGSGDVCLQIWDSGPEVPAAARKSIFLPWKVRGDDHPLRLAMARHLLRCMGWSLRYQRTAHRNEYLITVPETAIEVLR
jgi:K+-sensing histidine kinase KdpD